VDAGDHLSFGGGHHYCLGAALAKLEGQTAVGRLARRFERIELAGEPVYNGRINLRGLASLPLAVG
jgi:cytochrome P450